MTEHTITAPGGTTYDLGPIASAARELRDQLQVCERQAQLWCWEDKLKTKKTNRPNYRELILPLLAWHLNHGGTLPVGRAARAQHGINAATAVAKALIERSAAYETLKIEHKNALDMWVKERADVTKIHAEAIRSLRAELDAAIRLKDIREAEAKESREVLRGALEIVVSRLEQIKDSSTTMKLVRQAHGFASLVLDVEKEKHEAPRGAGGNAKLMKWVALTALGGLLYPAIQRAVADAGEAAK